MRNPLKGRPMTEPCPVCGGSGHDAQLFLNACEACFGTGKARIRCAQCWTWKSPDQFIGKKGKLIKRCLNCQSDYANWDKKSPEERAAVRNPRANIPSGGPLRVALAMESGNRKTGPIPVSMTSARTCPRSCALYGNGCYAEQFLTSMHWRRLSAGGGMDWGAFCDRIAELPHGQIWRHNEAGDLPGDNESIDAKLLRRLIRANDGRRGFTYTHKPLTARNVRLIREANQSGFTINISADSAEAADRAMDMGLPTTLVIPSSRVAPRLKTPKGRVIVACPAAFHEDVTCESCQLCYVEGRHSAVGFPAHGDREQLINLRLRQRPLFELASNPG